MLKGFSPQATPRVFAPPYDPEIERIANNVVRWLGWPKINFGYPDNIEEVLLFTPLKRYSRQSSQTKETLFRVVTKTIEFVVSSAFSMEAQNKFSHFISVLEKLYPEYNVQNYFYNHGPKQFVISLTSESMRVILEQGTSLYLSAHEMPTAINTPTYFSDLNNFTTHLQECLSQHVLNTTLIFVVEHTPDFHKSIVAARRSSTGLEFVIVDSKGENERIQESQALSMPKPSYVWSIIDVLIHYSISCGLNNPKISYFPTLRQLDMNTNAVFVLHDLFALKKLALFDYVKTVELFYASLIRYEFKPRFPRECLIQAIPEHSSLNILSQIFNESTQSFSNMRAQLELLKLAKQLLRHILFNVPIIDTEPGTEVCFLN